ncbi:MAG: LuxR C-terminal-related transcriptional regulator [Actinomycetota bacterium]|nr:LuxR C-terminal-related transcriptional regulator [Actinomycetota bacterium]
MAEDRRQRAVDRIAALSQRGLDVVSFWRECSEILAGAFAFDWYPCWFTIDPASLLITSHFNEDIVELDPAVFHNEYVEDDVNKIADLAASPNPVSTLVEATAGTPERSPRYRELLTPFGIDQELVAALRVDSQCWAAIALYREPGRTPFDASDLRFVAALAPYLATGARRGLLVAEANEAQGPDSPGLVVVDERGELESVTPGTQRWLAELPDGDLDLGRLPSSVLAVAARARSKAIGQEAPGDLVFSRVLSRTGRWVVLHGASLVSGGTQRAAVIIEPAHPARIAPLLMEAYGLTDREQEVTRLVFQGFSTVEIAGRLFISAHTVQAHLKNIFEKTGVRSRRELTARVFFSFYEPRVRDNERRARETEMLLGGPFVPPAPGSQQR